MDRTSLKKFSPQTNLQNSGLDMDRIKSAFDLQTYRLYLN